MADQANLTGIASVPGEPLHIGMVIHKAFIDVDEEGREAAAATAAITVGAGRISTEPIPFVADHPFVYIIRDNRTGDILFMGRLADPSRVQIDTLLSDTMSAGNRQGSRKSFD